MATATVFCATRELLLRAEEEEANGVGDSHLAWMVFLCVCTLVLVILLLCLYNGELSYFTMWLKELVRKLHYYH